MSASPKTMLPLFILGEDNHFYGLPGQPNDFRKASENDFKKVSKNSSILARVTFPSADFVLNMDGEVTLLRRQGKECGEKVPGPEWWSGAPPFRTWHLLDWPGSPEGGEKQAAEDEPAPGVGKGFPQAHAFLSDERPVRMSPKEGLFP
ncbi:MAG: hypothetical protein KF865_10220 [Bdellovibrionaceae bacterium]|nr:hypothetical protein [Pseudobdellovibrionaceae bacterium]